VLVVGCSASLGLTWLDGCNFATSHHMMPIFDLVESSCQDLEVSQSEIGLILKGRGHGGVGVCHQLLIMACAALGSHV
jgi:hypothetical protein